MPSGICDSWPRVQMSKKITSNIHLLLQKPAESCNKQNKKSGRACVASGTAWHNFNPNNTFGAARHKNHIFIEIALLALLSHPCKMKPLERHSTEVTILDISYACQHGQQNMTMCQALRGALVLINVVLPRKRFVTVCSTRSVLAPALGSVLALYLKATRITGHPQI